MNFRRLSASSLENGFVLLPEESDMELDAKQSGFVVMQKENQSVQIRVENSRTEKRCSRMRCDIS